MRTRLPLLTLLLAGSLVSTGCTTTTQKPAADDSQVSGGVLITRQAIDRTGARDAYEALSLARTHLVVPEQRGGHEPRITHRGRDSLVDPGQILVIVDGLPMSNAVRALRDIPVRHILYMKVLTAREATPRYGTLAGNGAVYIRTTAGA